MNQAIRKEKKKKNRDKLCRKKKKIHKRKNCGKLFYSDTN